MIEEFRKWCNENDLLCTVLINAGPNMEGYSCGIDSFIDGKHKEKLGQLRCCIDGDNLEACLIWLKQEVSKKLFTVTLVSPGTGYAGLPSALKGSKFDPDSSLYDGQKP